MAEKEQIHLDIQLRFHQKNDLKDFEIVPNSRPLKILLVFLFGYESEGSHVKYTVQAENIRS